MMTLEFLNTSGIIDEEALAKLTMHSEGILEAAKKGESKYSGSLGWLEPDKWAGKETLDTLSALAAKVREDADAFVLVGVGGSNNAARAVIEALTLQDGGPEIIYMGNTLSPYALKAQLEKLKGKSFYVNCIAKNFETLEPGASFRGLRELLLKQYGANSTEISRRIIATGTPGSQLESLCKKHGYTFLAFPPDIGGRYTALSNVGLLPMAVAGVDIHAVAAGAQHMAKRLQEESTAENIALRYACLRNILYREGYKVELLACFEPQYRWFFKWWIQLFAESEGKNGRGLFPVTAEYSEELHSVGQFVQDGTPLLFETFLDVRRQNASLLLHADEVMDGFDYLNGKDFWNVNKASFKATRDTHAKRLPCLTITVDNTDAESFGQLFYFFEFACYLSGSILGVNPFDQPGVEDYKTSMFKLLGK